MSGGTVKVVLRRNSWKSQKGDVVEVDSATADQLIADGHATKAESKAKAKE